MMTIDEAIIKETELSNECFSLIQDVYSWCDDDTKRNECLDDMEYHDQLVEWLELLKWYQQGMEDIPTESGVLPKDVYWAGYIKAIDEFAEKLVATSEFYSPGGYMLPIVKVRMIAEQLKAGTET